MFQNVVPSCKLFLMALWVCFWYVPTWAAFRLQKWSLRDRMVQWCNRGTLALIGVKLTVSGSVADARPMLLVTNHISYLDIPILASCVPLCFTPKSEIAGWPVIGSIARVSGAVFIDRRPDKMVEMKQALQKALAENRIVLLFPEATTGNGVHMEPFKSGLFSLAEEEINGQPLLVQPACITYTHVCGVPITTAEWPHIAWYSDMVLAPHVWELLKLGPIRAELTFLPPVTLQSFGDRKKLASHCQMVIRKRLHAAHDPEAAHSA